ncbi:MAG: hypothetical protein EXQ85_02460, partial [Alphaproteobacteria bacterium]|nr:hypothetical protein [Alphaproteobacteria bacterium]
MFASFTKAFAQLPDPSFRRVLLWSLSLSVVVFVALAVLAGWWLASIGGLTLFGFPLLSATQVGW